MGMIYLVRAAATVNDGKNYPKLLGRQVPQGLSETGKKQAQNLAVHLAKRNITAIYTSSMSAAVQTARAIRADHEVPLTFCSSLVEANFGTWEGQELAQLVRDPYHPQFMGGVGFPEGETFKQVCRRTYQYIKQLAETHAHDRIVVVSHEYPLRALICHLCKVPFSRMREVDQEPGRVSLVRVFRGVLELKAVNNDLAYVEEDMEEPCDTFSVSQSP
jgi:broad specificity phosphatase PhoE